MDGARLGLAPLVLPVLIACSFPPLDTTPFCALRIASICSCHGSSTANETPVMDLRIKWWFDPTLESSCVLLLVVFSRLIRFLFVLLGFLRHDWLINDISGSDEHYDFTIYINVRRFYGIRIHFAQQFSHLIFQMIKMKLIL